MRAFVHSVTASASKVAVPPGTMGAPNSVLLKNPLGSGITIYIDGSNAVSASTGFPLAAGESAAYDLVADELWVVGDGAGSLRVLARS